MNSLLHSFAAADLFLSRQGSTTTNYPSTSIISSSRPMIAPALWKYVHDMRISIIGDLYSYVSGSPSIWHDFSETGGKELSELQTGPPPCEPVHLSSNQYWLPSSDANFPRDTIVEIMGFTHDVPSLLNIRTLKTNNAGKVRIHQIMCPSRDPLMGGSSKISLQPVNALGLTPRRVYLSPPPSGCRNRSVGFISQPTSYSLPSQSTSPVCQWLTPDFKRLLIELGPFTVFSDGSWSKAGSPWDHITSNSPTFSGSVGLAFVSTLPDWKDRKILTLQLTNGNELESLSAFSMELLGILVGLSIASQLPESEINILSDCKSAVNKLHSFRLGSSSIRSKTRDASLLTSSVAHWRSLEGLPIAWTPGHPEAVQPDASLWTREMWGNHLADRSAAGELNFTTEYCYQNLWSNRLSLTPLPSLDAITLTSALAPPHLWYFGNRKKQLISPSAMDRIHQRGLDRYLVSRDKERWDRAKLPAKWQYINMHLAAKLWKMFSHGPMMRMKNRLMFDKHMHQGNLAKGVWNPKDAEAVAKCPFCIEQDSQEHWAINCSACSRTVNIRREALIHIRKMISNETSQHQNSGAKSSISSFGELYLSFLEGPTRSVGAWMGEWTSDQLCPLHLQLLSLPLLLLLFGGCF